MSDSSRRGALEFKQSSRQHLDNPSVTLYNRITMHHGKTSIFLFFLIIGTSVFPNGCSTGLASAKPVGPLIMAGMTLGAEFLSNIMKPQDVQHSPKIIYGAETNNENNMFDNKDVGGSLSFGSNTNQQGNYYGQKRSGSPY